MKKNPVPLIIWDRANIARAARTFVSAEKLRLGAVAEDAALDALIEAVQRDWNRRAGMQGGLRRSALMTAEQRTVMAKAAAQARWGKRPGAEVVAVAEKKSDEDAGPEPGW